MDPRTIDPALLVLDTNVVLDLFVFKDAAAQPLEAALALGEFDWVATAAMRDELERVLGYQNIAQRLTSIGLQASDVLARFDAGTRILEAPARAPVTCSDPDDQKFIDLAVERECLLLSKDAAVLSLKNKLAAFRVSVVSAIPPACSCGLS